MSDDVGKIVCENQIATQCPFCETVNWVYCGRPDDVTAIDIYSCHCYGCKRYFWLDENAREFYAEINACVEDDLDPSEADYEDGEPTPK